MTYDEIIQRINDLIEQCNKLIEDIERCDEDDWWSNPPFIDEEDVK